MSNQKLLKIAVKAADDKRAEDILALNMQGISLIADYFIICHGNSINKFRQSQGKLKEKAEENGYNVRRMEGFDEATWILIDLGDVIAHVFHRDERSYYKLERLWGDAPLEDIRSELTT